MKKSLLRDFFYRLNQDLLILKLLLINFKPKKSNKYEKK